jgi:hypothetical protein
MTWDHANLTSMLTYTFGQGNSNDVTNYGQSTKAFLINYSSYPSNLTAVRDLIIIHAHLSTNN